MSFCEMHAFGKECVESRLARRNKYNDNWYAIRRVIIDGKRRPIRMHRLILGLKKGEITDHKNHNGLDNRVKNIRHCTRAQNLQNARKRKMCTSRFKGVCYRKNKAKWQATITFNGKYMNLGYFMNEVIAALAYDRKAKELFGTFAYTNF